MVEFKVVLTWAGLIFILLVLSIIFKILPILGLFVLAVGIIIFLVGVSNDHQEDMVWGAILFFGGIAIIAIGFSAYSSLEEYGVISFIKNVFNLK
jgi:hypothetical protein